MCNPVGILFVLFPLLSGGTEPPLPLEQTAPELEPTRLLLKTLDWDTRYARPSLPREVELTATQAYEAGYWIIQAEQGRQAAIEELVLQSGGRVFDYVPHNAFEAWVPPSAVDALRLADGVQAMLSVHPGLKISPEMGSFHSWQDDSEGRLTVAIEFWPDRDLADEVDFLTAEGLSVLEQTGSGRYLRALAKVHAELLPWLASQPGVRWIEESTQPVHRNDKTQWVVQTNQTNSRKLWNHGVKGDNVIIGHMDGGIRESSCFFDDPTGAAVGANHRKIVYDSDNSNDSHGTHTAGSAVGDQEPTKGSTTNNGMAPHARIAHQSDRVVNNGNLLSKLNVLRNKGARVFTNSWGNDGTTAYNNWCRDIDAFSHDYQDAVVCFAATNGSNLKNPENAKSVVAVIATSKANPNNLGSGGKGPTSDGRAKPEVMAPGCSLNSAKSQNNSCGTTSMCGTSMACPIVAGGAAMVKQYFEDGYYPGGSAGSGPARTPSGSLLRGILANSGTDVTGMSGYPSYREGWGRILLDDALFLAGDSGGLYVEDSAHANGLATGASDTFTVTIPSGAQRVRFTLCWADEPASAFASFAPINNLNLSVDTPSGSYYHGNILSLASGVWVQNKPKYDPRNSLEQIFLPSPQAGTYVITVTGADVPRGPQGYALIVSWK